MPRVIKYSLNFGLIWGLFVTFSDLLFFALPFSFDFVNLLKLGLIIFSMYFFLKYYRNKVNGGYLTMLEAIRVGVNTGIAAGIIMGFVSFLLIEYGPQDFLDQLMRDLYTGKKFTEEQEALVYQSFHSPFAVVMSTCFTMALFGLVCSLLFGFLLRKEKTTFKNKIKE